MACRDLRGAAVELTGCTNQEWRLLLLLLTDLVEDRGSAVRAVNPTSSCYIALLLAISCILSLPLERGGGCNVSIIDRSNSGCVSVRHERSV